ncbi:hypothetical protein D3C76_1302630 [compost metagenome]
MKGLGFEYGYLDVDYGNIRISQLLAILILLGAVAFIIYRRVTGKAEERYHDPIVSTKITVDHTPEAILNHKQEKKSPLSESVINGEKTSKDMKKE